MPSDYQNGLREDRIRDAELNKYLDEQFEEVFQPDPDRAYDEARQRKIDYPEDY